MLHFYQRILDSDAYVWKIEESAAFFAERLRLNEAALADLSRRYRHSQALLEWLASRYLLFQVLGQANYTRLRTSERGKLLLPGETRLWLSLSHSEDLVALALSDQPVGIDLQHPAPERLERIAPKFVRAELLQNWQALPDRNRRLHLHWCTKEALFKAYGEGAVDFKQHLLVPDLQPPPPDTPLHFACRLQKPEHTLYYQAQAQYSKEGVWWVVVREG